MKNGSMPEGKENKTINAEPSRYAHFSPAQKWAEAVKLREMAWVLKTSMIQHNHPDWSREQVENAVREIFLYATT